jgi:hypothetical protein
MQSTNTAFSTNPCYFPLQNAGFGPSTTVPARPTFDLSYSIPSTNIDNPQHDTYFLNPFLPLYPFETHLFAETARSRPPPLDNPLHGGSFRNQPASGTTTTRSAVSPQHRVKGCKGRHVETNKNESTKCRTTSTSFPSQRHEYSVQVALNPSSWIRATGRDFIRDSG